MVRVCAFLVDPVLVLTKKNISFPFLSIGASGELG
jgi:hypothetical protein